MRLFLLGAAALFAAASSASAGDDPMATTYGNTLVSVSSGGLESHTYYNADHTFTGKVPSLGFEYKGTWSIDDNGQLCRTFDPPVPGRTNPDCGTLENHAVGEKWTASDGASITLVQGVN
jgi:hypothetical protein